jgi:hypothetical protein
MFERVPRFEVGAIGGSRAHCRAALGPWGAFKLSADKGRDLCHRGYRYVPQAGLNAPRPQTDPEDPIPALFDRPFHRISGLQVVSFELPAPSPLVEALAIGGVARQIPVV